MPLTEIQAELLRQLRIAIAYEPSKQIVYVSEYLGWLPYGLYHWVEVSGRDISYELPLDWQFADFEALEQAGYLGRVGDWQHPQDDLHRKVFFALHPE